MIFDPSGTRLYFSSQRGFGFGVIYEISGPFRTGDGGGAPIGAGPTGEGDTYGIRVTTRRRVGYSRLLARGGLPVRVKIERPGDVRISLTTPDIDTRPGERGSSDRPVLVTLGRFRRRFARRGARKVMVKLDRRAVRRLRRKRSVTVRVTAQLRDADGNVEVTNRRMRVDLRR